MEVFVETKGIVDMPSGWEMRCLNPGGVHEDGLGHAWPGRGCQELRGDEALIQATGKGFQWINNKREGQRGR